MAKAITPEWVEQWVYKAGAQGGSGGEVLHLEEDCDRLASANNVLRKPRKSFPDDAPICDNCGPDE